jgi:hypothetical protein
MAIIIVITMVEAVVFNSYEDAEILFEKEWVALRST